ncbi:MAG: hypothetical protein QM628_15600 [Propionicimonas sp.]
MLLVGCAPTTIPAVPVASVPSRPTPAATVAASPTADGADPHQQLPVPVIPTVVKDPVGECRETATEIFPPSDPQQICTYGSIWLGHTLAPKKGRKKSYFERLLWTLEEGDLVEADGRRWTVASIETINKRGLPDRLFTDDPDVIHLVTCDPASGYSRDWPDGKSHAKANRVVTLKPAPEAGPDGRPTVDNTTPKGDGP